MVPETPVSKQRRHLRTFIEFLHSLFWYIISLLAPPLPLSLSELNGPPLLKYGTYKTFPKLIKFGN